MPEPHRIVLREVARRDIEAAVDWYRDEVDVGTALRVVAALAEAFRRLQLHPGIGSPRYATELDLPGLRSWMLQEFPYVIFYVERPDHLDVWRVLHAQRDIATWLRTPGSSGEDDPAV